MNERLLEYLLSRLYALDQSVGLISCSVADAWSGAERENTLAKVQDEIRTASHIVGDLIKIIEEVKRDTTT